MKKKFILLCFILLLVVVGLKTVKATSKTTNNLIDMNQVLYDSEKDIFYSDQTIKLNKDERYTLVTSRKFLGSCYQSDSNSLLKDELGTTFTTNEGTNLNLSICLIPTNSGLYYSSIVPTEDCNLKITDFLTKGYSISTLPKGEIILFNGEKEEFQGFRELEYLDDYVKTENVINLYTSYNNLINVEEITNSIKCYDNTKGFYTNLELVEDKYQNTNEIGVYKVVYRTVDDNNNIATLVVNVNVVDNVAPVINGPDCIEWDCYSQAPTPEDIAMMFTAYDEIDGNLSNRIKAIRSSLIMYSIGVTKDYEVFLEVSDYSGNKTEKIVVVSAKDITSPTLVTQDVTLNLSDLGKSVFGDFFGQAVVEVNDNSKSYTLTYIANELIDSIGFAGEYELIVIAKDAAGNQTQNKVKFKIVDDIAPEFYLQTHLFNTTTVDVKNIDQLKSIIADNLHQQGILYDSIDLISCNYFSNETTPGTYEVKYAYSYNGEINYMAGTITVEEAPTQSYLWVIPVVIVSLLALVLIIRRRRRIL